MLVPFHVVQTSEKEMIRKELSKDDHSQVADASEDIIYKIDIPANRYDMLCLEGIARALNIFKGRVEAPQYKLADMKGEAANSSGLLALAHVTAVGRRQSDPALVSRPLTAGS